LGSFSGVGAYGTEPVPVEGPGGPEFRAVLEPALPKAPVDPKPPVVPVPP
jgi:hypothetical protein